MVFNIWSENKTDQNYYATCILLMMLYKWYKCETVYFSKKEADYSIFINSTLYKINIV